MLKTEHLPECWAKDPSDPPAWCICDELRSCEQRMRQEHRHRCSGCDWCYADGVREAIDAARKAVAPMEAVVLRIAATLVRHPSEDDLHDALQRHWCGELKAALFQYRAAIDALKESND